MRKIKLLLISILALSACNPAFAGGISGNFFPAPASTLSNTATTSSQYVQFVSSSALAGSDVMIKNAGTVPIYCDMGTGGASFTTTVPTNTVGGGFLINPGEADILNKRANDTVACITSTSTALFTATPGVGY